MIYHIIKQGTEDRKRKMDMKANTYRVVMTALMMCIIMIAILFVRVPIPFTQGYVHLGDAMIFLSVLILGWKYGAIAAALGGMLGDIVGGFAVWAPWTFGIKGIMALIMGGIITAFMKSGSAKKTGEVTRGRMIAAEVTAMVVSGAFMVAGYYFAEGILYGNWAAPVLGIPWNIGQFAVGMVIAVAISQALCATPARKYFAYHETGDAAGAPGRHAAEHR